MNDPVPLHDRLDAIVQRHGDAPGPERRHPEPPHRTFAIEYTDRHIPLRYRHALADHSEVLAWAQLVTEQAISDSEGRISPAISTGPSLLLLGATGVGKTHQAYGALRILAQAGIRSQWIALTAGDLYARLRPRSGVDSESEFRSIANTSLLIIDDLGAPRTSEWVEEINYRLINWRYERLLPMIVTSNMGPNQLTGALGERVTSRLRQMCHRIVLEGPDLRRTGTP